jgi:hypothetical protein
MEPLPLRWRKGLFLCRDLESAQNAASSGRVAADPVSDRRTIFDNLGLAERTEMLGYLGEAFRPRECQVDQSRSTDGQ